MTTAIAKRDDQAVREALPVIVPRNMDELARFSDMCAKSGLFQDAASAFRAAVKIAAGSEVGVPPITAMTQIHVVEGKVSYSGQLMAALIRRSGIYDYEVVEQTAQAAEILFLRRRDGAWVTAGTVRLTMEEAARIEVPRKGGGTMKLVEKSNWRAYPRMMLFWRAMTEGFRVHCPDLAGGMPLYHPEELGAYVDADGQVIEGEVVQEAPGGDAAGANGSAPGPEVNGSAPAAAPPAPVVHLVPSSSDPETTHRVTVHPDGTVECSCKSFEFAPAPKTCKHIEAVARGEAGPGPDAGPEAAAPTGDGTAPGERPQSKAQSDYIGDLIAKLVERDASRDWRPQIDGTCREKTGHAIDELTYAEASTLIKTLREWLDRAADVGAEPAQESGTPEGTS